MLLQKAILDSVPEVRGLGGSRHAGLLAVGGGGRRADGGENARGFATLFRGQFLVRELDMARVDGGTQGRAHAAGRSGDLRAAHDESTVASDPLVARLPTFALLEPRHDSADVLALVSNTNAM